MVSKIKIAPNGCELSKLALGLWRLKNWNKSNVELEQIIRTSIDWGITSFDHADIYGSFTCEEAFGEILKSNKELRNKIELITKCDIVFPSPQRPQYKFHYYDTSKEHIIASAERSLSNFGTDHLDVLLIHRVDSLMDADEVAEAFSALKNDGKVLNFGVSNFLPQHFNLFQSRLGFPLVTNQVEFSALHMNPIEDGTMELMQQLRISPMIWSPLAGGKIFKDDNDQTSRIKNVFNDLSAKYNNAAPDQLALAWVNRIPVDPVIVIGSGNLDRIKGAVDSLNINISREDWYRIWVASKGYAVP